MSQPFDGIEYHSQENALDLAEDFRDGEPGAEEIKPFQVAALLQEVEWVVQDFTLVQLDEVLLPA